MSPRFEADLTKVTATLDIFPKGDYEFSFGEPKAFARVTTSGKNAGKESSGVRYGIRCEEVHDGDRNMKGKRQIASAYLHSEGAQSFAKQLVMAVLGYRATSAEEQRFDAEHRSGDWSLDPETGACGDIWGQLTGRRAIASLDVNVIEEGEHAGDQQQQFTGWRPVKAA